MKNGSISGWRDFYQEWRHRFLLYARSQTRNLSDAEDVVQEAMIKVWERAQRVNRYEAGWVFNQIRRSAIDFYRSDQSRRVREACYVDAAPESSYFVGAEKRDALEAALRGLPPEQEEVLILKIWGDQTLEEIGRILEISPNTVASRYRYALRKLKTGLEEDSYAHG